MSNKETGRRPYDSDFKWGTNELTKFLGTANIIHLHGDLTVLSKELKPLLSKLRPGARVVQQFYHEKARTPNWTTSKFTGIVAKKGAVLEPELYRLPVVIPYWRPELQPQIRQHGKLKVVYTPTDQKQMLRYGGTKGKGYPETKKVLDALDPELFDVQIVTDLNWRETMDIKREADVVIDELVTGGFGQSSLEALAQGSIVIGNASGEVRQLYPYFFPYVPANVDTLDEVLNGLARRSFQERRGLQVRGPDWIQRYHSEDMMHAAYQAFYDKATNKQSDKSVAIVRQAGNVPETTPEVHRPRTNRDPKRYMPPELDETMPQKPMKILQIARTNCAGAIWRIHEAINRYSPHSCRTITFSNTTNGRKFQHDILIQNAPEVRTALMEADVIHFHNWIDHRARELAPYRPLLAGKKMVLQYHTEPQLLSRAFPGVDVRSRTDIKTLTIAQKHVRFYPNSQPVPNMVDPDHKWLKPGGRVYTGGPLKLIYSPSDIKKYPSYTNTCCGKGYEEMMPMLKKLEAEGLIKLTVVTDMTWEQLMPLKREHDICIDEVVTGGYHLCSLESLSQGLITIGWLDSLTQQAIHNIVGRETKLPWINVQLNTLEAKLRELASMKPAMIEALKEEGPKWMRENWHPAKLLRHFFTAYGIGEAQIITTFNRTPLHPIYRQPNRLTADIHALKGSWAGQRVVIWGNGPSAKDYVDHDWGPSTKHIGTNAILKTRPGHYDAYCISDRRFFHTKEKRDIANNAPGVRCYLAHVRDLCDNDATVNYITTIGRDGFCGDVTKGVFHGLSVVWVAIQIAAWAGAKEVLLVGCEHNYDGAQQRCYDEAEGQEAPVDRNNTGIILANYARLVPVLNAHGIAIATAGQSRLQRSGVPRSI